MLYEDEQVTLYADFSMLASAWKMVIGQCGQSMNAGACPAAQS